MFLVFSILKQSKEEANKKENIFGFLNCNSKIKKAKVKLQLEMKNKRKATTRIKLNKAKRNNKNIFGILGFVNTSKNKESKT